MAGPAPDAVYRFDGFTLDLGRGALFSAAGEELPLRPKSFALLRFLVENAGRVVSREIVMETLWPNVFVEDDNISQCIRDIRRVLDAEGQRLLRTVPRRGYIFASEVVVGPGAERQRAGQPIGRPAIAVLPFANLSDDPNQEYFSDVVADDIITGLSRNRSLFVVARASSFSYKARSFDLKRAARELGVRYVVDGSVRRDGTRVRITAPLIDAETSQHLWGQRFDRNLTDFFTVQDQIVDAMVAVIDPAIAYAERQRALQKTPENLSAWEAWQRALWHWSKGSDLAARRRFLELAVAMDPHFAPARAMLVWLYLSESTRGSGRPLQETVGLAEAEARMAVELDPNSAIAHAALAWVFDHQGNREAALDEAEIAIGLNPNDPQGHLIKGHILGLSGRPVEAQQPLETALRLDPRGPTAPAVMHNRAVGSYLAFDYRGAESTARKTIRAYPEHPRPYLWRAAALGQLGRVDDARRALDASLSVSPGYFKYKTEAKAPYMRPEGQEHLLDGLRKAGWRPV